MDTNLVLAFLGASILLTFMPGPDNIYVLTESLTSGRNKGVAISFGLASGVFVHTLFAALGLSLILQQSAFAFTIVKYLGAAYLFFLAYKAFTEEKKIKISFNKESVNKVSYPRLYARGFLMNVLNPKVSLFFIAFLPRFVDYKGINITIQMIVLGMIFMLQALIIMSFIAIMAGYFKTYLERSRFWSTVRWGKVGIFTFLGISLALAKNH